MFIYVPEQSLTLVGNSVSFEGYEQADAKATATPAIASFSGVSVYLQPDCKSTCTSIAEFAIDDVYIRLMHAVATPALSSFAITYPSNEILYYDPAYE